MPIAAVILLVSAVSSPAEYVLVLKSGGQLTVQSYREEGSMIKFQGFGGEIGLSKDQVLTIRRAEGAYRLAPPSVALERPAAAIPPQRLPVAEKPAGVEPSIPSRVDEQLARQRDEEEKAYQQKVKELTEQLREMRDRYSLITRGNQGPEPSFFTTEEAFKGHQDDLLSRLRDAQFKAQGLPTGSQATSPPLSLDPPPAYSERQKELSDLRSRMNQIEIERQRMIDEMKAKNFATGSLFLD